MPISLNGNHRGSISVIALGMVVFFGTALLLSVIIINAGFMVSDAEKQVVIKAMRQADQHLKIAGKITGITNVQSNEMTAIAIPARTASGGPVTVNPQYVDVAFQLNQFKNNQVFYNNIYSENLHKSSENSLVNALAEAKLQGIIDFDPNVDNQGPTNTTAFVYWIINQNFDQNIDSNELASLVVVYAEKDRPITGEQILIQANLEGGYILKLNREIPDISSSIINFGGKLKDLSD